ncbi:MAG: SRPBCC family protein, partial [Haloechinothrix sp.]
ATVESMARPAGAAVGAAIAGCSTDRRWPTLQPARVHRPLTVDTGVGRSVRPLGPVSVGIKGTPRAACSTNDRAFTEPREREAWMPDHTDTFEVTPGGRVATRMDVHDPVEGKVEDVDEHRLLRWTEGARTRERSPLTPAAQRDPRHRDHHDRPDRPPASPAATV